MIAFLNLAYFHKDKKLGIMLKFHLSFNREFSTLHCLFKVDTLILETNVKFFFLIQQNAEKESEKEM